MVGFGKHWTVHFFLYWTWPNMSILDVQIKMKDEWHCCADQPLILWAVFQSMDLAVSTHPVLPDPMPPWNGVSAFFIPIIGAFWGWFSSCFAFEKLASLLCRVLFALDGKDPLGQAVLPSAPWSWSPPYFSFPSGYTATDCPVKMLYCLNIPIRNNFQYLGDIFSVPDSYLCFLFYFYSYF